MNTALSYGSRKPCKHTKTGRRNLTHLLFSSHPFATKLPNTTSACVLVMLVFKLLTSRRAAKDETQKDSLGESMTCSIYQRVKNKHICVIWKSE